jgi:hypothetical protein
MDIDVEAIQQEVTGTIDQLIGPAEELDEGNE